MKKGSIATQYRPNKFSQVVGQDIAVSALKYIASAEGITVNSIFLHGSYGSGKTTLSRLFGRAINCEVFQKTGELCDKDNLCPMCQETLKKNTQLYIELDSTRVGSVEAVRNMDTLFSMSPAKGRRVICIDESATCSKSAQNALLKVLEEGVKNTFIVFASTDLMIPTIMSRSLVLEITPISLHEVKNRVKEVAELRGTVLEDNQLDLIAIKSKGHMRDALSFLELFEIAGPVALKSSLKFLKSYLLKCLKKEDIEDDLKEIMSYPMVDVKNSLSVLIKDLFVSQEPFEVMVRQKGLAVKIFNYFYTPVAQQALKDEYGVEILLRSFSELLNPTK